MSQSLPKALEYIHYIRRERRAGDLVDKSPGELGWGASHRIDTSHDEGHTQKYSEHHRDNEHPAPKQHTQRKEVSGSCGRGPRPNNICQRPWSKFIMQLERGCNHGQVPRVSSWECFPHGERPPMVASHLIMGHPGRGFPYITHFLDFILIYENISARHIFCEFKSRIHLISTFQQLINYKFTHYSLSLEFCFMAQEP